MGDPALNIRTIQPADVERAVAWAAAEGWNPGVDDAACFVGTDADGFLVGYLDGEPAGCILGFHRGRATARDDWNRFAGSDVMSFSRRCDESVAFRDTFMPYLL